MNDLIDGFIDEPEIDFAQRFSVPFPSQVFLTLFGLPMQDLPTFLAMKDGIIRPFHMLGTAINDPRTQQLRETTAASIYDYFNRVLDQRETERRDDLLSHFLEAEVDGERLTREEILDICFLLLIAGLDTVSASLDCFFRYLTEHPDKRAALVADPSISPAVVEELLRWESPVMLVSRIATQDTEIGGCPVHAGDKVHPFIGSANTDESEFPEPDVIRWGRKGNRHIAFGPGCIAAWGPTSPGSNCESRFGSGTAVFRITASSRAPSWFTPSESARRIRSRWCSANPCNSFDPGRTADMGDRFIQIVFSNPLQGRDEESNQWYENVHIPQLLAVPGMLSAQRYTLRDAAMYHAPGGRPPDHRYAIIYEMEGDVEAIMQKIQEGVAAGQIQMHDSLDMDSWRLAFWTPHGPKVEAK